MSTYDVRLRWRREGDFLKGHYQRGHDVIFDGHKVRASASPHIVPAEFVDPSGIDPEKMLVASLSSCHMLWFLDLARREGHVVETYEDSAEGTLAKNAEGKVVMSEVVLRPKVSPQIPADVLARLHEKAHDLCFIANSVTTEVRVEPA
jgi:organic hydroperoxide reductase OsmC/OhrA